MGYTVTGIRNSNQEGWFRTPETGDPHPWSCTARIDVDTPLGTIIVEVSGDSAYPGVYLSFKEAGDSYERTVALLEAESEESVALKVWKDERESEDWTYRFPVAAS